MAWPLTESERSTVENCLRNLRALSGGRIVQGDVSSLVQSSGRLQIQGAWGEVGYQVLPRVRLGPTTVAVVLNQFRERKAGEKVLLFTDYLSEPLARELRLQGVEYIDAAGNMFLNHAPLYVEISGRKRIAPKAGRGRAFQVAGLKLITLFLQNPSILNETYRQMAQRAGVALGAIGQTLDQLNALGYIGREDDGRRVLLRGLDLLQRWEFGYSERLRPRLFIRSCRLQPGAQVEDLPALLRDSGLEERILLGGELGASLLLGDPRPRRAVLHLGGDALRTLVQLRLIPDPAGPVDLLRVFGDHNAWQGWQPEGLHLVDPLMMHADLIAGGNGPKTMSERLLKEFLQPRLPEGAIG